ncbi:hypothetical protein JCM8547_001796 [Rhodosporidiobolus lusitaniae]
MPLFPPSPLPNQVPIFNSACPWASSAEDLKALWECDETSAVTTRTCTLRGFEDDQERHQMTFFGPSAQSSSNSYGYSPHPLSQYLDWIRPFLLSASKEKKESKRVIVSITGTVEETEEMLGRLGEFAGEVGVVLGVEFNASCPNFRGHPPPAYVESELSQYLSLLARYASPSLKVGVKLPPYTYDGQFDTVSRALSSVKGNGAEGEGEHPITFLTATNTLGQGLVFTEQITDVPSQPFAQKSSKPDLFALPGGWGGLAGAAVHQTALGNIHRLSRLLHHSPQSDPRLKSITLIGVGGACDAMGVERFRRAGAGAVACATGLGREGLEVFRKMKQPLSKL